jgi:alkanesulfonate monooxygenase SsuD/methylene tetrahydromethanopterin reductase-like flavin-dependent oxidoreductase (luciferase family)
MKLSTVILPTDRWAIARDQWGRAEAMGLHGAYTYDHLSWRNFRERPWFSMVPTLSAAAALTRSIRIGPLVTSPNFRHPLLLAKDLIAIDDVSNGRLSVAIGSGGTGFDATVLGHEAWSGVERHERFVEFAHAIDTLLRETSTTIDAPFYPIVDSRQLPGPVQRPRPPLWLSALGPKTIAVCVEMADGWISIGGSATDEPGATFAVVEAQSRRMDDELDRQGRTPATMHRVLLDHEGDEMPLASFERFLDWAGRYRALGFNELVIHWPTPMSQFDTDPAVFEHVATEGREIIAAWDD